MTRKAASTNVGLRKLTKDEVKVEVSFTNHGVIILSNRVVALFFLWRFSDIIFRLERNSFPRFLLGCVDNGGVYCG